MNARVCVTIQSSVVIKTENKRGNFMLRRLGELLHQVFVEYVPDTFQFHNQNKEI